MNCGPRPRRSAPNPASSYPLVKRILIVGRRLREARRDRATFDRRHDGGAIADPRFFLDAADEAAADI